MEAKQRTVGVILFPKFEVLDVFGPVEAFGILREHFKVTMVAEKAGAIVSAQGPSAIAEYSFANCPPLDIILVPGGIGTREGVKNDALIKGIAELAAKAEVATSVCTGAALLAQAGLLDGKRATTNKFAFQWVVEQGPRVNWVKSARWVEDGKFATSSGVSAGIDMALAVIAKLVGREIAEKAAARMEYEWHSDPANDPFAKIYGLA
jgi:transcriptional regulator GlxA family with amidase domain